MKNRRTEELLNGVYSQYLRERNCYNSTSNPISHVSFPHPPTAPIQNQNSVEAPETPPPEPPPRPLHLYKPSDIPIHQMDNQIDSGHPSISGSNTNSTPGSANSQDSHNSPTNTIHSTESVSPRTSVTNSTLATIATTPHLTSEPTETTKSISSGKPDSGDRPNPFLAGNRGPNKVILQPIEYPLRQINNGNNNALVPYGNNLSNVPRHLFTAKSPHNEPNINHKSSSQQNLIDK